MISALRAIPSTPNKKGVAFLLLGHMSCEHARDPASAYLIARVPYQMAVEGDVLNLAALDPVLYFDDALDLARSGIQGDTEFIRQEMSEFLAEFG